MRVTRRWPAYLTVRPAFFFTSILLTVSGHVCYIVDSQLTSNPYIIMNQSLKSRYLSFRRFYGMTATAAYSQACQTSRLLNRFALWQSRQPKVEKVHPLSCRGTYQAIMNSQYDTCPAGYMGMRD